MGSRVHLMTIPEVAEALVASERHVRELIKDGEIPAINTARGRKRAMLRIMSSDLEAWMKQRVQETWRASKDSTGKQRPENGATTSRSKVVGLEAIRAQRASAKQKRS